MEFQIMFWASGGFGFGALAFWKLWTGEPGAAAAFAMSVALLATMRIAMLEDRISRLESRK